MRDEVTDALECLRCLDRWHGSQRGVADLNTLFHLSVDEQAPVRGPKHWIAAGVLGDDIEVVVSGHQVRQLALSSSGRQDRPIHVAFQRSRRSRLGKFRRKLRAYAGGARRFGGRLDLPGRDNLGVCGRPVRAWLGWVGGRRRPSEADGRDKVC